MMVPLHDFMAIQAGFMFNSHAAATIFTIRSLNQANASHESGRKTMENMPIIALKAVFDN
jgi:hypothetical protein